MPTKIGASLVLIASLAGCQSIGVQPAPVEDTDESVAELIEYGLSLRGLNEAQLERLHRDLILQNRSEPSSPLAIRLALLLGYPDSSSYDLDRAINLFNQVARTRRDENPVFRDLAELMSAILIERRTLAVEREVLTDRHAADVERIEQLQARLDAMQAELAAERERSEKLQGQLDALIELEEQLTLDAAQVNGAEDGE